jgi:hypothetical protein
VGCCGNGRAESNHSTGVGRAGLVTPYCQGAAGRTGLDSAAPGCFTGGSSNYLTKELSPVYQTKTRWRSESWPPVRVVAVPLEWFEPARDANGSSLARGGVPWTEGG